MDPLCCNDGNADQNCLDYLGDIFTASHIKFFNNWSFGSFLLKTTSGLTQPLLISQDYSWVESKCTPDRQHHRKEDGNTTDYNDGHKGAKVSRLDLKQNALKYFSCVYR